MDTPQFLAEAEEHMKQLGQVYMNRFREDLNTPKTLTESFTYTSQPCRVAYTDKHMQPPAEGRAIAETLGSSSEYGSIPEVITWTKSSPNQQQSVDVKLDSPTSSVSGDKFVTPNAQMFIVSKDPNQPCRVAYATKNMTQAEELSAVPIFVGPDKINKLARIAENQVQCSTIGNRNKVTGQAESTRIIANQIKSRTIEDFNREFGLLQEKEERIIGDFANNFEAEIACGRAFESMCSEIKGNYARFDKVLKEFFNTEARTCLVEPFNSYIGFSVPSQQVIDMLYTTFLTHLEKYPEAKLVDLGTGSGIYPWLLHRKGVAKDKLVAVDLVPADAKQQFEASYWNVLRDNNYVPHTNDMIFISWGYGRYPSLDTYLLNGGKCVVIVGEIDGITLDASFFSNQAVDTLDAIAGTLSSSESSEDYEAAMPENERDFLKSLGTHVDLTGKKMSDELKEAIKGWTVETWSILTVNMWSQDYLSVNTKYN